LAKLCFLLEKQGNISSKGSAFNLDDNTALFKFYTL